MQKILITVFFALSLTACEKPNSKPTYGDTGFPKNCKAIIKAKVEEYKKIRKLSNYELMVLETDDIMDSIDRNCGADGFSWQYD